MNDDPGMDEAARRVRDAVQAHGRSVPDGDDGSLAVIRHRVAMARRRRLVGATALGAAAALVIGIAIGVGVGGGGDGETTVAAGGGSTTTTLPCPPSTVGPETIIDLGPGSDQSSTTSFPSTVVPAPTTTVPGEEEIIEESEHLAEENCGAPTTGPTTTTTATSTTTRTETTTTTVEPAPVAHVFPTNGLVPPDVPWPWPDAESTARAFLELAGVTDPALGALEPTRSGAGRMLLYARGEDGSVRTDTVRSELLLGTVGGHWAVLEARSASIVVDGLGIEDRQSVVVRGRGRGFEGTIVVRVLGHGDVEFGEQEVVTAGGGEELVAFTALVDVSGSSGQAATVLLTTTSGLDGSAMDVTALPVHLP